jgi:hypothetical protein
VIETEDLPVASLSRPSASGVEVKSVQADLGRPEQPDRQRLATKLVRKLDQLGFTVTLAQRQTT